MITIHEEVDQDFRMTNQYTELHCGSIFSRPKDDVKRTIPGSALWFSGLSCGLYASIPYLSVFPSLYQSAFKINWPIHPFIKEVITENGNSIHTNNENTGWTNHGVHSSFLWRELCSLWLIFDFFYLVWHQPAFCCWFSDFFFFPNMHVQVLFSLNMAFSASYEV